MDASRALNLSVDVISVSINNMDYINISVPELMREWVEQRIGAGHYASASDYVRELIERDQAQMADHRTEIREKIAAGLSSLRSGKGIDGAAFLADLDTELKEQGR